MPRRCAPRNDEAGWTALFGTVPPSATPPRHCERSAAIQCAPETPRPMDCHAAALLAMTEQAGRPCLVPYHPPPLPPSLRAKRGNPVRAGDTEAYGLPRRYAPRNDVGAGPQRGAPYSPPSPYPGPVIASEARQSSGRRRHRGPWIATSLRSPQCRRRRWLRSGSPSGYSCPHASGQTPC